MSRFTKIVGHLTLPRDSAIFFFFYFLSEPLKKKWGKARFIKGLSGVGLGGYYDTPQGGHRSLAFF